MSATQSFSNNNFGGIRRKDSAFSQDKITCSDCQNVELYYTKMNSGVGIRTVKGNKSVSSYIYNNVFTELIPDGEEVIGIFESIQDGNTYFIVYTESISVGTLYSFNLSEKTLTQIVTGLEVTGNACGTDFQQGWLDYFIFSNGVNIKYIYSNTETHDHLVVETDNFKDEKLYTISNSEATEVADDAEAVNCKLTATVDGNTVNLKRNVSKDTVVDNINYYGWSADGSDYYTTTNIQVFLVDTENRDVSGLGLIVFDSRLWIFKEKSLWYSKQGECRDFTYQDADIVTSAGYIEFVKEITAIYPYLGSIAVFHRNSSALVKTDSTTVFIVTEESPGGCAGYNSLVFHGTDLYFYDDTKKGVFSFQQIVNGDKTLGQNIAYDIQDELLSIDANDANKIRTLSVVTEDRNEVWFLIPISSSYEVENVTKQASIVLIFDYIRGEWVKRKCQKINAIGIVDGVLYSAGTSIYHEYITDDFNGDFIESYYNCSVMNLGTDNSLKITKMPPRIALDSSYKNNFYVRYIKNYNKLKSNKEKEIKARSLKNILIYDSGMTYDSDYIYSPNNVTAVIKLPSATFKALEIQFYTQSIKQSFCIMSFEISKLKVKQV